MCYCIPNFLASSSVFFFLFLFYLRIIIIIINYGKKQIIKALDNDFTLKEKNKAEVVCCSVIFN